MVWNPRLTARKERAFAPWRLGNSCQTRLIDFSASCIGCGKGGSKEISPAFRTPTLTSDCQTESKFQSWKILAGCKPLKTFLAVQSAVQSTDRLQTSKPSLHRTFKKSMHILCTKSGHSQVAKHIKHTSNTHPCHHIPIRITGPPGLHQEIGQPSQPRDCSETLLLNVQNWKVVCQHSPNYPNKDHMLCFGLADAALGVLQSWNFLDLRSWMCFLYTAIVCVCVCVSPNPIPISFAAKGKTNLMPTAAGHLNPDHNALVSFGFHDNHIISSSPWTPTRVQRYN